MDETFDDGDEDERDDVAEAYSNDEEKWPSIERTISFDDWNDDDDLPSPRVFRFDDWSCKSIVGEQHSDDESIYTSTSDALLGQSHTEQLHERPHKPSPIYYMDDWTLQKTYTNSSSTRALIPPSHSYLFQPIREGDSSRGLSLDPSVAPTVSLRTSTTDDDPFSISGIEQQDDYDNDKPECPGIPRVRSEDEEVASYDRPAIRTIQVDLGDNEEEDEPSQCYSSPTNFVPPIPHVIYIRKEAKGWKKKIISSWKRVVAVGRHNKSASIAGKNRFKRRRGSKLTRGEF